MTASDVMYKIAQHVKICRVCQSPSVKSDETSTLPGTQSCPIYAMLYRKWQQLANT